MDVFPIGFFRSPFKSKFGIPKQSGLITELEGVVVLLPEYSNRDFLRGIDGFDYLWLIWQFSNNKHALTSSVVRPPLLGGNEKVGIFATRSPYRPNALGLSSVRLLGVESSANGREMVLKVSGADLQDGTPIFDIKPYLPYTDSHADARAGFVDSHPLVRLRVEMADDVVRCLSTSERTVLRKILELDPRPHYHNDATKVYGLSFLQYDIKFRVEGTVCRVVRCDLSDQATF